MSDQLNTKVREVIKRINLRYELSSIASNQIVPAKEGMWSVVLETLLTTLRLLVPATLFTFFWGHHSLVYRFFHRFDRAIKSVSHQGSNHVEVALIWLNSISTESLSTLDAVWSKGSLLCEILDSVVPGSCPGHGQDNVNIGHSQAVAEKLLGVSSIFTNEELNSTKQLTPNQEWRFANYLIEIRDAIALLNPPVSKPGSARCIRDIQAFTLDYVARGMGLVTAETCMKAVFYIYPTAQQGLEPGDISVHIRGPEQCYGSIQIPALYGKGHLNNNNFGIHKNKYSSSLPGSTYLRTYGDKDIEKHYSVPKIKHNIMIDLSLREDHARIYYTPEKSGRYDISLISKGCNIVGSPFNVSVPESRPERRNSVELNDDNDLLQNRERNARKIVYRIVDFVTEKMLLTDDGKLEKISEEKVQTILNSVLPTNESKNTIEILNKSAEEPKRTFKIIALKVQTILRTLKIFKKKSSRLQPYDYKSRTGFKFPDLVYLMTQKCIAERRENLNNHMKSNQITNTNKQLEHIIEKTTEPIKINVTNLAPEVKVSNDCEERVILQNHVNNKDKLRLISESSFDPNFEIKHAHSHNIAKDDMLKALKPEMEILKNIEEQKIYKSHIDNESIIKPVIIISCDDTCVPFNPDTEIDVKTDIEHIEIKKILDIFNGNNPVPDMLQSNNLVVEVITENDLNNTISPNVKSAIISDNNTNALNSNIEYKITPEYSNISERTNVLENFDHNNLLFEVADSNDFTEEIITENNLQNKDKILKPAIIILNDDIFDSTLYWEESNETPTIPNMDRPITPIIKILEIENEQESVSEEKNECFNIYVNNQSAAGNIGNRTITSEAIFKTDFKIGAPVSNLPSIKTPSPVPDMESVLLASNLDEALRQYDMSIKTLKKINSISSNESHSLPILNPLPHISYDDMTDSDIINFYDRNLSEQNITSHPNVNLNIDYVENSENVNVSGPISSGEYESRCIDSKECNKGQVEFWDSAYISIDDNNKESNPICFPTIQEDNDVCFADIPKSHQRKYIKILEKSRETDVELEHNLNVESEYATTTDDKFSKSSPSKPTFKSIEEEEYLVMNKNILTDQSCIINNDSDEHNDIPINSSRQNGFQEQNNNQILHIEANTEPNAKNTTTESSSANSVSVGQHDVNSENIPHRWQFSENQPIPDPSCIINKHSDEHNGIPINSSRQTGSQEQSTNKILNINANTKPNAKNTTNESNVVNSASVGQHDVNSENIPHRWQFSENQPVPDQSYIIDNDSDEHNDIPTNSSRHIVSQEQSTNKILNIQVNTEPNAKNTTAESSFDNSVSVGQHDMNSENIPHRWQLFENQTIPDRSCIIQNVSNEHNDIATNSSRKIGSQEQSTNKMLNIEANTKSNAKNTTNESSLVNSASVGQHDVNSENIPHRWQLSENQGTPEPSHINYADQKKNSYNFQSLTLFELNINDLENTKKTFREDKEPVVCINNDILEMGQSHSSSEAKATISAFEKKRSSTNQLKQSDSFYNTNENILNKKMDSKINECSHETFESQDNTSEYYENDDKQPGSLVSKWKKYWDEKLRILNENDGLKTIRRSYDRNNINYRSQPNIINAYKYFEEKSEKYDCAKSTDNLSETCGSDIFFNKESVNGKCIDITPDEELKVFESSPKRYFVRAGSREKITSKINTFKAAPENISQSFLFTEGNRQETGFVTRRLTRYHSSPDCKKNTKNPKLFPNTSKVDKQNQKQFEINSSSDLNKLFYKPTEKMLIAKEDTSDLKEKKDFLNRYLTERIKQTKPRESVITVSQNALKQNNDDPISEVKTDTRSVSVHDVIANFENHSQSPIKTKTMVDIKEKKLDEVHDEKQTQNQTQKISVASAISMRNYLKESNIYNDCTASEAPSKSSNCDDHSDSTINIAPDVEIFKKQFRQTKNFFESLQTDRIDKSKEGTKLNECQMIFLGMVDGVELNMGKSQCADETSPILDKPNVSKPIYVKQSRQRRHVKAFSAPTSDTEYDQGIKESRLFKISERFQIEHFFRDIAGDGALKRSGSLRGIPHKNAVLAAFRSIENLNGSSTTSYDHTTSQLSDFAQSNGAVKSQTYSNVYPFLPTTEPGKYRSRYDAAASGMMTRADMLRLRKKTRRYSVPDEWKRILYTEI